MPLLLLYAFATFLSALLLFGIQPLIARQVLPLMGGSPAVWTTCMLFFQALLLGGYAYAHFSSRWLGQRLQAIVHLTVVCLPLALSSASLRGWELPADANPVLWLLLLLLVSIGGPFFALSATTPLLQRWFAGTSHASARDPYFLYAASNSGSLAALLAYPFVLEPFLGLSWQTELWWWGYVMLAALVAVCAAIPFRFAIPPASVDLRRVAGGNEADSNAKLSTRRRLEWLILAFIPSSWMLGVTETLTTEFLPIPLLWVLPLALYLMTFILAFARRLHPPRELMRKLFTPAVLLLALMTMFRGSIASMIVHLGVLLIAGLVCHGELVRRRPPVEHLTEFYLWVSVGGVLGGFLNAVIAPLLFSHVLEYPLTIVFTCLVLGTFDRDNSERAGVAVKVGTIVMLAIVAAIMLNTGELWGESIKSARQFDILLIALPAALICDWLDRPLLLTLAVGVPLVASAFRLMADAETLYVERSFFGEHLIQHYPDGKIVLLHGPTVHGWQNRNSGRQCMPGAYYHPAGPLGDVIGTLGASRADEPLAIVGLGAGACLCYQAPGQKVAIYEIDPAVVRIAQNPEYFTYLSHCAKGDYTIVIGDGRLKLAEAEDHSFGMIILDTFSGDAVPTHLLTRQAMQLYLQKLTDDGILILHISNVYLDLEPAVADLAADAGCHCATGHDPYGSAALDSEKLSSIWMVVARDAETLEPLLKLPRWEESTNRGLGRPWTDDYSSTLGLLDLRWK